MQPSEAKTPVTLFLTVKIEHMHPKAEMYSKPYTQLKRNLNVCSHNWYTLISIIDMSIAPHLPSTARVYSSYGLSNIKIYKHVY